MKLPSVFSKVFYAILISPLLEMRPASRPSKADLNGKRSRYKRAVFFVQLADRLVPGGAARLSRLMYKHSPFPWKPVDSELFAFGSGTAIILLNSREGSKVLRIYRKSLGKPLSGLLEVTRHYKENLEILRSWYGNSTDLIPPMEFLVLSGLPFGSPVAASLQPYIRGQKKDFFADFSDEELLELLEQHRHLRKQFELFASQTLRQWEDGKMCFDFLGRENLMTVNQDGNYRLCIVDVGIFQFDKVVKKYPQKIIQIEKRMDRLATLYHKVKQVQPHITPDFDV